MKINRSVPPPTVVPILVYPDVRSAGTFLTTAFGFVEPVLLVPPRSRPSTAPADRFTLGARSRGQAMHDKVLVAQR